MNIEDTYFHTMSVSRYQSTENEWGAEEQSYLPLPLLQLIPCAFSQGSRNSVNHSQTDSTNIIEYTPKIFCNPLLDILAGDRITINYGTRVIGEFTASEPYIYQTHQEIPIIKLGEA